MKLSYIASTYPTPEFPYFGARIAVSEFDTELKVTRAELNGVWDRDVWVFIDGECNRKEIMCPAAYTELRVRTDWTCGQEFNLKLEFSDGTTETIDFTAHGAGSRPLPEFGYYAGVVLTNPSDIDRVKEPVRQPMGVYADRITDPYKEVRVVEIDPATGVMTEIPSQITNVSLWDEFADEHCQPTCNFDVVFLASVKAFEKRVYLVFYGNPNAEKPVYETALKMTGEGYDRFVENEYYKVKFHELSGGIDEVTVKQGLNLTFAHHLETNGSMDWSPDIYAPPTPWNHTSDWDPPENIEYEVGPVFITIRRWGFMPMYEDVRVSVTYEFYADYRPIIVASTMELTKDRDIISLRGGEVVINRELATEVAWRNMDGTVTQVNADDLPRHPTMGQRLPATTPWTAFLNSEKEAALGVSYIEAPSICTEGGVPRLDSHLYVHVGFWIYIARPLMYTFVGNNPQRVMRANKNTIHYEKRAWHPMRIQTNREDAWDAMEDATNALKLPLQRQVFLDTDNRVPTEWIPPFLLAEFIEI